MDVLQQVIKFLLPKVYPFVQTDNFIVLNNLALTCKRLAEIVSIQLLHCFKQNHPQFYSNHILKRSLSFRLSLFGCWKDLLPYFLYSNSVVSSSSRFESSMLFQSVFSHEKREISLLFANYLLCRVLEFSRKREKEGTSISPVHSTCFREVKCPICFDKLAFEYVQFEIIPGSGGSQLKELPPQVIDLTTSDGESCSNDTGLYAWKLCCGSKVLSTKTIHVKAETERCDGPQQEQVLNRRRKRPRIKVTGVMSERDTATSRRKKKCDSQCDFKLYIQ
jgi:hypothetical protein